MHQNQNETFTTLSFYYLLFGSAAHFQNTLGIWITLVKKQFFCFKTPKNVEKELCSTSGASSTCKHLITSASRPIVRFPISSLFLLFLFREHPWLLLSSERPEGGIHTGRVSLYFSRFRTEFYTRYIPATLRFFSRLLYDTSYLYKM